MLNEDELLEESKARLLAAIFHKVYQEEGGWQGLARYVLQKFRIRKK